MINEGILIFTAILDSIHVRHMENIVKNNFDNMLKFLFHENLILKKSASWFLLQVTDNYAKIFDRESLSSIIPVLINCLNDTNIIAINICSALVNLIRQLGDLNTVKNSSKNYSIKIDPLSKFFEDLFKQLLTVAEKNEAYNTENNLFTACYVTVNTLIEYSSHDKQEKLEEIIVYLLGLLENTIKKNLDNRGRDQQSSISLAIHFAINKMIKTINLELASKVYLILVEIFKQRQGVFDEAVLIVSSLALSKT